MRYADLAVIVLYLGAITWFGARFRRSQHTLKDYFLGGRTAPWWAIALSIVSAETSTLTIIGTPTLSFTGDFGFLQVVLGYLLARIVISTLFLPHYFRGEMFTAYQLIERCFGARLRKMTAATFLVIRALAEGVRVFAISIVISIVLGTGELASIVVIVLLTLFYTFEGGMTAVIWTDVVQMCLYVVGGLVSLFVIVQHVPGGWTQVLADAPAEKFRVFHFGFALSGKFFSETYSFWAGLIGGCFLTTASHGTEQLMVQRFLAARTEGQSRAALFASWVVIAFQFSLFLAIGLILFVFYRQAHLPPPKLMDSIYPRFVWEYLPVGVAGLVVAAILAAAMSNLSAALNSLASTTVVDFLQPLGRSAGSSEGSQLRLARIATILWGFVLLGIGSLARHWGPVLETGLTIASLAYGGLLGVFLLGVLPFRVKEAAAMTGMVAGIAAVLYLRFGMNVAWTWYVAVGTAVTMAVALAVERLTGPAGRAESPQPERLPHWEVGDEEAG
jgi:SSS family solute:Na+ symporter